VARARCPNCNYIAETTKEEDVLSRPDLACPKCGVIGRVARIAPHSHLLDVATWVGEFAVSNNHRDHVAAVVLFCALTESILETLKDDYLKLHPPIKSKSKRTTDPSFEDVFGKTFGDVLKSAPTGVKGFPSAWEKLRNKRNKFLHGKSSSYQIREVDAHTAMDLTLTAIWAYVWLNNRYCLKA
jgi:hypothetical protein